jgi:hypothetical protein
LALIITLNVVIATGELGIHKPDPAPITAAIKATRNKAETHYLYRRYRNGFTGSTRSWCCTLLTQAQIFTKQCTNTYYTAIQRLTVRCIHNPTFSQEHFDAVQKEFDGLQNQLARLEN